MKILEKIVLKDYWLNQNNCLHLISHQEKLALYFLEISSPFVDTIRIEQDLIQSLSHQNLPNFD